MPGLKIYALKRENTIFFLIFTRLLFKITIIVKKKTIRAKPDNKINILIIIANNYQNQDKSSKRRKFFFKFKRLFFNFKSICLLNSFPIDSSNFMKDPIPGMSIDKNAVDGNITVFVALK